jgi:hypothetical protein
LETNPDYYLRTAVSEVAIDASAVTYAEFSCAPGVFCGVVRADFDPARRQERGSEGKIFAAQNSADGYMYGTNGSGCLYHDGCGLDVGLGRLGFARIGLLLHGGTLHVYRFKLSAGETHLSQMFSVRGVHKEQEPVYFGVLRSGLTGKFRWAVDMENFARKERERSEVSERRGISRAEQVEAVSKHPPLLPRARRGQSHGCSDGGEIGAGGSPVFVPSEVAAAAGGGPTAANVAAQRDSLSADDSIDNWLTELNQELRKTGGPNAAQRQALLRKGCSIADDGTVYCA